MSGGNVDPMAISQTSSAFVPASILEYSSEKWILRENYRLNLHEIPSWPKKCYIFIDKESYPKSEQRRRDLLHHFNAPEITYSKMCTDLNGYFGCKGTYNEQAKLTSYGTWFRCLVKMMRDINPDTHVSETEKCEADVSENEVRRGYIWYEMGFFTRWDHSGCCRVLCIDTPKELQSGLESVLRKQSAPLKFGDPFAMHIPLIDQIILQYDISVWRVRNPVREIEKARQQARERATKKTMRKIEPSYKLGRLPDFAAMHEISRHVIHVSEVLSVTIQTIEGMQRQQKAVYKTLSPGLGMTYEEQAQEHLSFQLQMVRSLKLRSISNAERLENEINLKAHEVQAYNMIIRQDNAVVKTIAILTMLFLPASFISALFSTTFFTFSNDGWHASNKLWVFFVITVPSTILILAAWRLWLYGPVQCFDTSGSWKNFLQRTSPKKPSEPEKSDLSV